MNVKLYELYLNKAVIKSVSAKYKKPVTQRQMLCDCTYRGVLKSSPIHRDRKEKWRLPGAGGEGRTGRDCITLAFPFYYTKQRGGSGEGWG